MWELKFHPKKKMAGPYNQFWVWHVERFFKEPLIKVRVRVRVTELGSFRSQFAAVTRCHRGVFRRFLAHRNRETVAQLLYNRDFRWFGLLWPQFAIYWFLGSGGLVGEKFRGPVWGPKRGKNTKKWILPVLGAVLG